MTKNITNSSNPPSKPSRWKRILGRILGFIIGAGIATITALTLGCSLIVTGALGLFFGCNGYAFGGCIADDMGCKKPSKSDEQCNLKRSSALVVTEVAPKKSKSTFVSHFFNRKNPKADKEKEEEYTYYLHP